jgi:eukaryotic translation initiation factor 2C
VESDTMPSFGRPTLSSQTGTVTLFQEPSLIEASLQCTALLFDHKLIILTFDCPRFDFDFYLQAHAGLQGHVKATHYTVVYDENRLGADELQQGTHTASYLYARATKAVSLVPAAYYADLACERGRCYLNDFLSADDKVSSSVVSGKGRGKGKGKADKEEEKLRVFEEAKKAWGEGVHPDLRASMFYI